MFRSLYAKVLPSLRIEVGVALCLVTIVLGAHEMLSAEGQKDLGGAVERSIAEGLSGVIVLLFMLGVFILFLVGTFFPFARLLGYHGRHRITHQAGLLSATLMISGLTAVVGMEHFESALWAHSKARQVVELLIAGTSFVELVSLGFGALIVVESDDYLQSLLGPQEVDHVLLVLILLVVPLPFLAEAMQSTSIQTRCLVSFNLALIVAGFRARIPLRSTSGRVTRAASERRN